VKVARRANARRGAARVALVGGAVLVALAILVASRAAGLFDGTASVVIAVEPGQDGVSVPTMATGVNVAVWDNHLRDPGVPDLLRQAGVGVVRYPGGATADVYHWRTNTITPGQDGYVNPANNVAELLNHVVGPAGARLLITVNYGSNESGGGGGDPAEAAAWVYYANRLHHQDVRYWEIGNEVYGNGYYGRRWETDLHSNHSPEAYARNALAYIKAMKAVDPTIKVGLDLVVPGDWPDGLGPQRWNETVLAIAGHAADFVSLHWYAQQTGAASDARLLSAVAGVPAMMAQVRSLLTRYAGPRAAEMSILLTETNSAGYNAGQQTTSVVNGLFLIQDYLAWLQAGASLVAWWDLHNGPQTGGSVERGSDRPFGDLGLLSSGTGGEPEANTPFPAYTALTLLRHALGQPAVLTRCSASVAAVTAYALQQSDTRLSLVLVNTSPAQKYTVTPSVAGVSSITGATVSSFGVASPHLTTQRLSVTEGKVSYAMPPYSAVVLELIMPPGQMPLLPAPLTAPPGPTSATPGGAPSGPVTTATGTAQTSLPQQGSSPQPTAVATQGATRTSTATPTPTTSPTLSATPTSTATTTPSTIPTAAPSGTPTTTLTATPSGTPTSTATSTSSSTATASSTSTATPGVGTTVTPATTATPSPAVTTPAVPTGGHP